MTSSVRSTVTVGQQSMAADVVNRSVKSLFAVLMAAGFAVVGGAPASVIGAGTARVHGVVGCYGAARWDCRPPGAPGEGAAFGSRVRRSGDRSGPGWHCEGGTRMIPWRPRHR